MNLPGFIEDADTNIPKSQEKKEKQRRSHHNYQTSPPNSTSPSFTITVTSDDMSTNVSLHDVTRGAFLFKAAKSVPSTSNVVNRSNDNISMISELSTKSVDEAGFSQTQGVPPQMSSLSNSVASSVSCLEIKQICNAADGIRQGGGTGSKTFETAPRRHVKSAPLSRRSSKAQSIKT